MIEKLKFYLKLRWIRLLERFRTEDHIYECPNGCQKFVMDTIPWPCGGCGAWMVRRYE